MLARIERTFGTASIALGVALSGCAPSTQSLSDSKASRAGAQHARTAPGRNPYSANVSTDPHVLDSHRALAQALARSCAQTGEHCELANGAADYVAAQSARR